MRVLFVAAELAPFAKVGGLADVAAGLPPALARLGLDVRVAIPKYRAIGERAQDFASAGTFPVTMGGKDLTCSVSQGIIPASDVPIYFLGHDPYFDRRGIYGEQNEEYPDSLARFAFLSRAALGLGPALGWLPDVIHANDWHTALAPVYLRAGAVDLMSRSVLTIHNLAYQGWFPIDQAAAVGLNEAGRKLVASGRQLNLLRGGIQAADWITTVSPTYAEEILTRGEGLEDALQARRDSLTGILNGIDTSVWDPSTDPHLWAPYSSTDLAGKVVNKRALQEALGLAPTAAPLLGMVSRLAEQKGFDLLLVAFERMMAFGIQFVLLGEGDARYASFFRDAEQRYPGRVRALIEFSEPWAHRIEAGADIFLMPSRFEPAGLNQLYSLRYGAVPVVHATGGLKDTIRECDPVHDRGNGFLFAEYTAEAMLEAVGRAIRLWRTDPEAWRKLVARGMAEDHSWNRPARQYCAVYERVVAR
ncbi:MAG TPA: glycogen synthase GlgA [Candidatus Acetothermia bacterium]|nr:glycogen synthase GlgA [Candidatus Acetothermia bacterium]